LPVEQAFRILHLEDIVEDSELLTATLEADGMACHIRRVDTEHDFRSALAEGGWDLIVSDFSLPSYDGLSALAVVREEAPGVPFLFVSGAIGEDRAIDTLKKGATDYVLKNHLSRLAPAVRRALVEKVEHENLLRAEEALRVSEEQLRQAQKMEALGRFAGAIAHDFNNLLNVIVGYTEVLQRGLPADDPRRRAAGEILKASDRGAALVRQLMAFGRRGAISPREVDVNAAVQEVAQMLRRLLGVDVELELDLTPEPLMVSADPGQVERVLMNLAINARDAMPGGGRLSIQTRGEWLTEAANLPPGSYVRLVVRDTGLGISPDVLPRIFEPFFTTKGPGRGTGLGLATVYAIVRDYGGAVEVESELERGSTFVIRLPQVKRPASARPQAPVESGLTRGGHEKVLIVEDEEALRNLMSASLTEMGYTVTEAPNGEEGLRLAQALRPDLVVTDAVMPRLSGRELVEQLARMGQRPAVLFISGYGDAGASVPGEPFGFLAKPFTSSDLAARVRSLLDEAHAGTRP
jgi:signal transduction histidine kinase